MNRYQRPEVYERLAMEYSLGTLKGKARVRFEKLMDVHPFIRVTVDDMDAKFANLAEKVPSINPPASVWDNIQASIASETKPQPAMASTESIQEKSSFWSFLTGKGFAVAAILVLLSGLFLFNVQTPHQPTPEMFASTLMSSNNEPMAEVKAMKSDMMMKIVLSEQIKVPEGKQMTFWCLPKDPTKAPMNMGTLVSTGSHEMEMTQQVWKGLMDASEFVISFEPMNSNNLTPTENMYSGKIKAMMTTRT